MINKILKYLSGFDGFKNKVISVDYDEFNKSDIVICPSASSETVKKYADGGEIKQFVFTLKMKTDFDFNETAVYILFKDLNRYMSENPIGDNILCFEILEQNHLKNRTAVYAEYEMKFRAIYLEERND